jgi:hypothetical protein
VLASGAAAGFYEATAQVLPIFLLVLIVGEARLGATSRGEPSDLGVILLAYVLNVALLLAGEVAALIAVASGETYLLHILVCVALASSIALLMMRFLITTLDDYGEHFSQETRRPPKADRICRPCCDSGVGLFHFGFRNEIASWGKPTPNPRYP